MQPSTEYARHSFIINKIPIPSHLKIHPLPKKMLDSLSLSHTHSLTHIHISIYLQSRAVNHLQVDNQLASTLVDHQHPDTSVSLVVGTLDLFEKVALVDDGDALLDVAALGHGHDLAIVADVQNTVLLEDGAEHGLHHDRGLGVAHKGALLVQFPCEQVHAEVSVLARLR